nr:BTB/POZ and TAZ domain-containing protein 1-like [Ipomoea batatas]
MSSTDNIFSDGDRFSGEVTEPDLQIITSGGRRIPAHSSVLGAASPVLEAIKLKGRERGGSSEGTIGFSATLRCGFSLRPVPLFFQPVVLLIGATRVVRKVGETGRFLLHRLVPWFTWWAQLKIRDASRDSPREKRTRGISRGQELVFTAKRGDALVWSI